MEKKRKLNDNEAHEKVLKRLSRIEGQIKGIRRMVEEGRECIDVIQQVTAIRQAIAMLGIELLKDDFICKRKDQKEIDERYLETLFKIQ